MHYGLGTTTLGACELTSWTFYVAFIIVAGNLWSLVLGEWCGIASSIVDLLVGRNCVIIASSTIIGWGNQLITSLHALIPSLFSSLPAHERGANGVDIA